MRTRTKDQEKALLRQAEEIRAEYDYLDAFEPFVWVWEFVRRSERYRSGYARIQSAISKGVKETELLTLLEDFREQALEDGIITFSRQTKSQSIHSGYLTVKAPREFYDQSRHYRIFSPDYVNHSVYIPDPKKRYIDLNPRPFLRGYTPAASRRRESLIEHKSRGKGIDETARYPLTEGFAERFIFSVHHSIHDLILMKVFTQNPDWTDGNMGPMGKTFIENITKHALTTDVDKDTVYIAISRSAKHTDLKKHLLAQIKHYLIPNKPRKPDNLKWKHYLIVYDLTVKRRNHIAREYMSDLLAAAYPNVKMKKGIIAEGATVFSPRNLNNSYKEACKLIEGEYKQYLL